MRKCCNYIPRLVPGLYLWRRGTNLLHPAWSHAMLEAIKQTSSLGLVSTVCGNRSRSHFGLAMYNERLVSVSSLSLVSVSALGKLSASLLPELKSEQRKLLEMGFVGGKLDKNYRGPFFAFFSYA